MQGFVYSEERLLFDQLFRERGGIYGYDYIDGSKDLFLASIINVITDHIESNIRLRELDGKVSIYTDFVNNASLGAVVAKQDNTYYIGIHIATVHILRNFFCRALSCPDIMVRHGDVTKENQEYKLHNPCVYNLEQLINQEQSSIIFPVDGKRRGIADFLTLLAVEFIVGHELGHIFNGHIDYLRTEGVFAWDESDSIPSPLSNISIIQTLEFDADCFGWNSVINLAIAIYKSPGSLKGEASFLNQNLTELVGLACFAIYTTFRLFGNDVPAQEELLSRKHPHPRLRRDMMQSGVYALLDLKVSLGRIDEQQKMLLLESMVENIIEVERAFSAVTLEANELSEDDIHNSLFKDSTLKFIGIFNHRWVSVRQLLLPYALIPLVPVQV